VKKLAQSYTRINGSETLFEDSCREEVIGIVVGTNS